MKANIAEEYKLILKNFHATMPLKDTLDYAEYISNMMTQFQKAYFSSTSGFVLTTIVGKFVQFIIRVLPNWYQSVGKKYCISIIANPFSLDLTIGRKDIKTYHKDPKNIKFGKEGMGVIMKRFESVLMLHPSFAKQLSDFDRSALWRSNFLVAGALGICLVR